LGKRAGASEGDRETKGKSHIETKRQGERDTESFFNQQSRHHYERERKRGIERWG
jgi:hypothetical protein